VSAQILAELPSIIPAIQLPESYKAFLSGLQVFKLDLFEMTGVGCYSTGWNLNWMLLSTTVLPLVLCGCLAGLKMKDGALAVTFLVLPTVTTTIFKIFSCDELDTGTEFLHADYSISCNEPSHVAWVAYVHMRAQHGGDGAAPLTTRAWPSDLLVCAAPLTTRRLTH
jgi:hypothetical protein